jgi:ribonuclease P protein component
VKRRLRVRRRADFQAAISGARFYSGRSFVGFAVPTQGVEDRVGVTVSRTVKGSVDRNRARRRLREVTRQHLLSTDSVQRPVGIRYDVVLIARPAVLEVSFADLKAEASLAAHRLSHLTS